MKCPICGKVIKTKAGLVQHERDKHGGGKAPSKPVVRKPKPRNRGGPPIARGTIGGIGTGNIRFRATERLETFEVVSGASTEKVVALTSGITERFRRMASCFQRVRWHSAILNVVGKFPSIAAGGYLVAPVADSADEGLPLTAEFIATQRGVQTGKWWENKRVVMPLTNKLLYTSVGEDPRLYTPGFFAFISDGVPSQAGSVTFTLSYDVEFSVPGIQPETITLVATKDLWRKSGDSKVFDADFKATVKDWLSGTEAMRIDGIYDFYVKPGFTWTHEETDAVVSYDINKVRIKSNGSSTSPALVMYCWNGRTADYNEAGASDQNALVMLKGGRFEEIPSE